MSFKSSTAGYLQNRTNLQMRGLTPAATPPSKELAKSMIEMIPLGDQVSTKNGTDSIQRSMSFDSNVPINLRNQQSRTQWPVENRPSEPAEPAPGRIFGNGLFRRYPDGQIDVKYASGIVEQALRKSYVGIPLTENEAMATNAVFPKMTYKDLPPSLVSLKAPLSKSESAAIRSTVSQESVDILRALGAYSDY